ncbi:MAG: GNAT family N-acetyltransferase [Thermoanaerobaculales bacterium]|nr:GNAT family N-acetyltransferase [Thermoanaerobaculales bacterium]
MSKSQPIKRAARQAERLPPQLFSGIQIVPVSVPPAQPIATAFLDGASRQRLVGSFSPCKDFASAIAALNAGIGPPSVTLRFSASIPSLEHRESSISDALPTVIRRPNLDFPVEDENRTTIFGYHGCRPSPGGPGANDNCVSFCVVQIPAVDGATLRSRDGITSHEFDSAALKNSLIARPYGFHQEFLRSEHVLEPIMKVKVRRTHREELPGMVVLRDASLNPLYGSPKNQRVLDLDMEADTELNHLMTHDPDGFFTVVDKDETLGFASACVRSRQLLISQLWVLPQHRGCGAGDALLAKTLAHGESSGTREFFALVPADGPIQGLLLAHDFRPVVPVFHFRISQERAEEFATSLTAIMPGKEMTDELLARTGQTDVDRIDRLTRNITREIDYQFWLKRRGARVAFVRQGSRIAAYGFGGAGHVGPIAGSTADATLCALGRAIELALEERPDGDVDIRVSGAFTAAIDSLIAAGGRIIATSMIYGKGLKMDFDRVIFGPSYLP